MEPLVVAVYCKLELYIIHCIISLLGSYEIFSLYLRPCFTPYPLIIMKIKTVVFTPSLFIILIWCSTLSYFVYLINTIHSLLKIK